MLATKLKLIRLMVHPVSRGGVNNDPIRSNISWCDLECSTIDSE